MKVSAIICCYNAERRIRATLDALLASNFETFEAIVVDNNSSDGTGAIVGSFFDKRLRMVTCKKQGLAFARQTGIESSRGEIVVFVDDDNHIAPDYLSRVAATFDSNPAVGVVGGRPWPLFDAEFSEPEWFQRFAPAFAVGAQAAKSGIVDPGRTYLFGAGLAVRAHLLRNVYGVTFRPLLVGRLGKRLLAGDDSELCAMLLLGGWHLFYDDLAQLHHYMPADRLTIEKICAQYRGFGLSHLVLEYYLAHRRGINGKSRLRRYVVFNLAWGISRAVTGLMTNRDQVDRSYLRGVLDGVGFFVRNIGRLNANIRAVRMAEYGS